MLAAFLSIIPGLGTFYNGQYAKGLAYLLMIVVLDSLGKADHMGIFGLLSFVLWVYQIVDAYQTARARLEGRPLPNPFGLNEIGERMGFGRTWGTSPATAAAAAGAAPTSATAAAAGYAPVNYGSPAYPTPVPSGPDWWAMCHQLTLLQRRHRHLPARARPRQPGDKLLMARLSQARAVGHRFLSCPSPWCLRREGFRWVLSGLFGWVRYS